MKKVLLFAVGLMLVSAMLGYMFAQATPAIDQTKKGASVLVLGCIDPRFANSLAWYLTHSQELHMDYDLVTLAGASLGVLQTSYHSWQSMFLDHVRLAIELHDIKEIWCFDHMDCGMYKATLKLEKDDKEDVHIEKLQELKTFLKEHFPRLGFKGFIIGITGSVSTVV
jgi:carbonic anhydrase